MNFESGSIYHIYNQGNNRQLIFFRPANYLFFREKIKTHLLPYADVLAYCLMPNHFHLMVEVREVALLATHGVTAPLRQESHPGESPPPATHGVTAPLRPESHPVSNLPAPGSHPVSINTSIGIMLRSYTRAINLQERRTGALFREATKAICLTQPKPSRNWFQSEGITYLNVEISEWQYPATCFRYIQNNPVNAGLVSSPELWEYSSSFDISNNRVDLINVERLNKLGYLL